MSTQLDLFSRPLARNSDPRTSHLAAASVRPAQNELITEIRAALDRRGPLTQEEIAVEVKRARPDKKWREGSIVSACSRACLYEWDVVLNSRRRPVVVWSLIASEAP